MFFRKDNNDNEKPEDFVLFSGNEQADEVGTDHDTPSENASNSNELEVQEDLQSTKLLNAEEISEALEETNSSADDEGWFQKLINLAKKNRVQTIAICVILIAAIIAGAVTVR